MFADAPHVLVIRRRYLGDIVLLGSVLRNLRLHWPTAQLTVLTEPAYADVLALNPDVNTAFTFPRALAEWPSFLAALRRARFTHVFDFDNTEKTSVITRFTGALLRVAFDRELIKFRYPRLYTHSAKVTNAFYDSNHITETYLQLLKPLGVPIATRDVRLVPQASDLAAIAPLIGGLSSKSKSPNRKSKILIHPGSRSAFRIWPAERFAAVADRLQDELGAQVFLVAGPAEQALVREIRSHAKTHLVALDRAFSVGQFAALLAQFDVFLCHDSGPMHVAAAVGTPVVALFSSQNATIWRPLGERHTVLQTSLPCACFPSGQLPVPCVKGDSYRSYCVRQLDVETVFSAVRTRLTSGRR
ncbi:MAG: glycosyltransferase family 9 protein [Verrucomicrobia bacterium]|nr:glycosyltransferase family 9 protein [Verrucomicrobiota bacterium]